MTDGTVGADQARVAGWSVPGYTEVKKLGSGGFGDVVLATHDGSGTQVAIKYLRPELLADAEFAEMFRGEAAVLASINDPNVVRLYDYVETSSGAAIVMELVDGVSLRDILERSGETTPEAALVVLEGSLLGLAAAHDRGVVHRDYKPDNVLVGGDGASKLTDFGIAVRAGDRPMPAGTLMYAPPEQIAGEPATPAGDVYAATATFFECLTGRPPFRGDTAQALLYQHLSQPVPVDAVPEPVRPLVAAGMAKQPADRPADATTFVAALNSVAARAYGPGWRDRGRSHLAEAALLLAALWPSGGPAAVQGSTVARTPPRRRNWRSRLRFTGAAKAAVAIITVAIAAAGTVVGFALTKSSSNAVTPPAVTGVSPDGGSTAGGTTVSITGTGLAGAAGVRFGAAAAVITADSATQITVKSPPGSGTVTITVTTRAGTAKTAGHYAYTTQPKRAQSISFTAPASATAGGSVTLSAAGGGSGDPVVFSVDSSSGPGVCTVSGTTVTFAAAGTCVIDANQAGTGSYAAAPQVQQTITVSATPQPISTTAPAPGTVVTPKQTSTAAAGPTAAAIPTRTTAAATPAPTTPAAAPAQAPNPPGITGWAAAEAPLPAGTYSNPVAWVNSTACPSASSCVAAGSYTDSSGSSQGLLLTGSGTSWTATEAPAPANAATSLPDVSLDSIACASASSCVAVGRYADSSGSYQGVLLTGSGTSWTATEAPLPAGGYGVYLTSVTCPSPSSCVAAGYYNDSSGEQGLLLTGSGTSWTATKAPAPAGATADPSTMVNWVTCPSASSCVAVGSYADSAGNVQGLLLTGSGTSWTATEAPLPSGDQTPAGLDSAACASPSSCVAVGSYDDSSGNVQGLLLTGSGTSWTATEAPLPAGARDDPNTLSVYVRAVTCVSVSSCVAVGNYADDAGDGYGLLLTGSGTSWTATEAPLPAGADPVADLDSVVCPSASSCVAVGAYSDTGGDGHGLVLTGSGTSWTATEAPLPANAGADPNPYQGSVTCPSTSSCLVAGQYVDSSGYQQGLLVSATG